MIGEWIAEHETMLWWSAGISLVVFFGSLAVAWFLIIHMPADYFLRKTSGKSSPSAHPAVRLTLKILKNMAGVLLLAAGVIMLFTPGQGVLAILLGVSLVDFPGKIKLQIRFIRNPKVSHALNRIRERNGKPPLKIPDHNGDVDESETRRATTSGKPGHPDQESPSVATRHN